MGGASWTVQGQNVFFKYCLVVVLLIMGQLQFSSSFFKGRRGGGERKTSLVTSLYSARDDRRHFRGKKRMMTARLPFVCSLISRKNFCAISGSLSRLFLFLMHLISAQFTKTEGECKSAEIGQRSERLEQIRLQIDAACKKKW